MSKKKRKEYKKSTQNKRSQWPTGGAEEETCPDSDPNPDQCTFAKGATPRKVGSLYSSTWHIPFVRLCELSGHAVTHETRSRSHLLKDGCCCTGDSGWDGMGCFGVVRVGMGTPERSWSRTRTRTAAKTATAAGDRCG